jgi:hypothetical protein
MIGPGSLVKCINDTFHPESMRLIPNRPEKGKHYFVREIEEYYGAGKVGLRLEEIQNPNVRFSDGAIKEPSFDIDRFSSEDDVDLSELLEDCFIEQSEYVTQGSTL